MSPRRQAPGARVRSALLLSLLSFASCAPPTDGGACTTDSQCPTDQRCTVECLCVAASDAGADAGSATCPGFRPLPQSIALPGNSVDFLVQVASKMTGAGQRVAVALSTDEDRFPSVRVYERGADNWTAQGGGVRGTSVFSRSPMSLAPDGSALLMRLVSGVALYPLEFGGLGTPTSVWSGPATAVAHGDRVLVASLETVTGPPILAGGVFRKETPLSLTGPAHGELLHPDVADGLATSSDGRLIVIQGNGGTVRVFLNGTQRTWTLTPPSGVVALALSADGARLALARSSGVDIVNPETGSLLGQLTLNGVTDVALDRSADTLVALAAEGGVVFSKESSGWKRRGVLPLEVGVSGVALSGDGRDLFVGTPSTQQLRVFRRVE